MLITKEWNGQEYTRDINISPEQWNRMQMGEAIWKVCDHLSTPDQEFLDTGMPPEEYIRLFGEEEEEDDDY